VTSSAASDQQAALRIALSRYNTGDAERGFRNGYVGRVEDAAIALGLSRPAAAAAATDTRAPPTSLSLEAEPPPPWDIFGRARADLFVISNPAAR
jgi:type IV secretion system protein VirB1